MVVVNDVNCWVLSGSTKYGIVTAWISPERSCNAVKLAVEKGPNDFYNDYQLADKNVVTRTFEAIGFAKVGDIFVVCKGRNTQLNIEPNGEKLTEIQQLDVNDIQLNPDFQAIGAFEFRIPDGTPVVMTEHLAIKYVWRNGKAVPEVSGPTFSKIDKTIDGFKQQQ